MLTEERLPALYSANTRGVGELGSWQGKSAAERKKEGFVLAVIRTAERGCICAPETCMCGAFSDLLAASDALEVGRSPPPPLQGWS